MMTRVKLKQTNKQTNKKCITIIKISIMSLTDVEKKYDKYRQTKREKKTKKKSA